MSTILITGGAGFIGTNLAYRLLTTGHTVCILDNLSRKHVVRNLSWLMQVGGDRLHAEIGDIRDRAALKRALTRVDHVFHLAPQVAETQRLDDPRTDFDTKVAGSVQLLDEIRSSANPASVVFTSTSKVYGPLPHIPLRVHGRRYVRADGNNTGIDESEPLIFHSPHRCSTGAVDQYLLDCSRTHNIRAAVFRISSICGPHQFGTEDHGWVAHMLAQALAGKPITIYGDGYQVRDVLFVDDLVDALLLAKENIDDIAGEAFNVGGGVENTISLMEFLEIISEFGARAAVTFAGWRTGDQKYYVSNTRKFRNATGWRPQVGIREAVAALHGWLVDSRMSPELMARKAS